MGDFLTELVDLQLRDNLDRSGSFEVTATFNANDWFEETSLRKKVTFNDVDAAVEPAKLTSKGDLGDELLQAIREDAGTPPRSVIGWFLSSDWGDEFSTTLRRDLWQDPHPYQIAHASAM